MNRSNVSVHEIPAPYTNRIYITMTSDGARLTFGESPDSSAKDEYLHTAVWMPMSVFEQLQGLVEKSLKAMQDAKQAASTPASGEKQH